MATHPPSTGPAPEADALHGKDEPAPENELEKKTEQVSEAVHDWLAYLDEGTKK